MYVDVHVQRRLSVTLMSPSSKVHSYLGVFYMTLLTFYMSLQLTFFSEQAKAYACILKETSLLYI